jgi:hypothetical protein
MLAGEKLNGNLTANDVSPSGAPLQVILHSKPRGHIGLERDGSFEYEAPNHFTGRDAFQYSVHDGNLESNVVSMVIDVKTPVPVARSDHFEIVAGGKLTGDVRENDLSFYEHDTVAELVSGPKDGHLHLDEDGTLEYEPDHRFTGRVSFSYRLVDKENQSEPATVTIDVRSPVPVARPDTYTMTAGDKLRGNLRENDSSFFDQDTVAILASGPKDGQLHLDADGTFEFEPDHGYTGRVSFSYFLADKENQSEPATVTVNVRSPVPVARPDTYTMTAGDKLRGNLRENDSSFFDQDTVAILASGPKDGQLHLDADGTFEFEPDHGFTGRVSFSYFLADKENQSEPATVVIDVSTPAPIARPDTYDLNYGSKLRGNVRDNDVAFHPEDTIAVLLDNPKEGHLSFRSDGTFEYEPNRSFSGFDTFTYLLKDKENESVPTTVTISVSPPWGASFRWLAAHHQAIAQLYGD